LVDYEELYKIVEFREAFEEMFNKKILYRSLMISKGQEETRRIHMEKLYVF
jgi:hypothetical protein